MGVCLQASFQLHTHLRLHFLKLCGAQGEGCESIVNLLSLGLLAAELLQSPWRHLLHCHFQTAQNGHDSLAPDDGPPCGASWGTFKIQIQGLKQLQADFKLNILGF